MIIYCQQCNSEITSKYAKKFCSQSCSASHNNKNIRRHGKAAGTCDYCGKPKSRSGHKYCSTACGGDAKRKYHTPEEKLDAIRLNSRIGNAKYNAKKRKQIPPDADHAKIKEIYKNCPNGHEVDHIRPISKGGLHHQDNLQYLTVHENRRKSSKLDWQKE